jgi:Domain of unknown function (DU1801)
VNAAAQISVFLAKYTPEIAGQLQAAREHLASHFPRGYELVYDNYNALVFAFASSEKASDAVLSVAAYPKWVTLFFWRGADLPDPKRALEGSGTQIRSVRLQPPGKLHEPAVQALIAAAKSMAGKALEAAPPFETVVKSVSAKQRDRKPSASAKTAPRRTKRAGPSGA